MLDKRGVTGTAVFTLLTLIAYGGMVQLHLKHSTLRDQFVGQTVAWYSLAFVLFLAFLLWVERRSGVNMRWVWGTAVLFRLLFLLTTPTLSDDVYRYLWDGYVATQGVSPYAYAIDDPALDHLAVPPRSLANNTTMASPYLPAAQAIFWGITAVFPLRPLFLQMAMIIFDLATALILSQLLALASLPAHRLLLYLWNPLVIIEVAHGAHIDAWMIFLTLLAVWLVLSRARPRFLSPLCLALATLTKVLPIFLLPILFWRWSWQQLGVYAGLVIGLLLPSSLRAGWGLMGELDGRGLFGALRIYGRYWEFYGGIPYWWQRWWGQLVVEDYGERVARGILAVAMVSVLLVVWWWARERPSPRTTLRLMAIPYMAYLLLTPTLHPWYMLILLIWLPILSPAPAEPGQRWFILLPWLYLNGIIFLTYLTYINPLHFAQHEWIRWLIWLPMLTLLVVSLGYYQWVTAVHPRPPSLLSRPVKE